MIARGVRTIGDITDDDIAIVKTLLNATEDVVLVWSNDPERASGAVRARRVGRSATWSWREFERRRNERECEGERTRREGARVRTRTRAKARIGGGRD